MVEAKLIQRFGAFVIDMIIVCLVTVIGFKFIAANVEAPTMSDELIATMPDDLKEYYDTYQDEFEYYVYVDIYSGDETLADEYYEFASSDLYLEYESEVYSYYGKIFVDAFLVFSLVVILYMSVLPAFWDKQTVGRLLLKVKVVGDHDEKIGFGKIFSREYLCGVLLNFLNVCCGLVLILNCVFLLGKNRTLADMATKTKLVRYDQEAEEIYKERQASQEKHYDYTQNPDDFVNNDDDEYYVGDEKVHTRHNDNE